MSACKRARTIRVLIADDDAQIIDCYKAAFGEREGADHMRALNALDAELFDNNETPHTPPTFDVVVCSQGQEAVQLAEAAVSAGESFDVAILDVRMPPGIDGVETGSRIREIDPHIEIVFVTGFSDIARDEIERRVPPAMKLHYFNKPLSFMKLAEDVAGMIAAR